MKAPKIPKVRKIKMDCELRRMARESKNPRDRCLLQFAAEIIKNHLEEHDPVFELEKLWALPDPRS